MGDLGGLSRLAGDYNVIMCDLWGTLHDGLALFPSAGDALSRFRASGGTVILLSNTPRMADRVEEHLKDIGVPDDCWDAIVTSGDVTVDLLCETCHELIFHLGPDRDLALYEEVRRRTGRHLIICGEDEAEIVVCSGTGGRPSSEFDDILLGLSRRHLPMLCANPDLTAQKGAEISICAGTLASRYTALGGRVSFVGKPYSRIYARAVAVARTLRSDVVRILAIGDGEHTDMLGAERQGWDSLKTAFAPRPSLRQPAADSSITGWLLGQAQILCW